MLILLGRGNVSRLQTGYANYPGGGGVHGESQKDESARKNTTLRLDL